MDAVSEPLAVIGGTIIDGCGGEPIKDGVLVIEGKRIADVGGGSTPVPPHARRIAAQGKFLIPGLMDASCCLVGDYFPLTLIRYEGHYDELAIEAAQLTLKNGVTTVFDTWGPKKYLIKAREAINKGRHAGSRIYLAGNIVGFAGPFSDEFLPKAREVLFEYSNQINAVWEDGVGPELMWMSPDEARVALRQHAESGIDFIRYAVSVHRPGVPVPYIAFSPRIQGIIVDEGHRACIAVQSHTTSVEAIHLAMDAGVDLMPHVEVTGSGHTLPPETVDMLVQRRMPCGICAETDEALAWFRERHPLVDILDCNQRALLHAGAMVLLSTNSWVISSNTRTNPAWAPYSPPFDSFLANLGEGHFNWLLAVEQKGMKAMDALMAATRDIARAYKVDKDLGTLQVGKIADLLILDKNPLERAANYRSIAQVIKDGMVVDRSLLPNRRLLTAQ